MRGTPETWAKLPPLKDVIRTIARELDASVHRATIAGVDRKRIVLDPGLGFGKRKEQNSEVIAQLELLAQLELPIMVGPSRKLFLARDSDQGTAFATASAVAACVLMGAHMVRVHDVKSMRPVVEVADEIARSGVQEIDEEAAEQADRRPEKRPDKRPDTRPDPRPERRH
jgi:dihydropteroate synthase